MSTVLVSNPAGTVGLYVVKYLLEKKVNVVAAVRNTKKMDAQDLQQQGAKLVEVNYDDVDSLVGALKGIDKFVFISPLITEHQKFSEAWINALKKYKAAGGEIKHVIRLSCYNAENPTHLIGKWHAFIEVLIKATDIPYTFVRPNFFFQNLSNFFAISIHQSSQYISPSGKAKISFVDANDVAKVLAHITLSNNEYFEQEIALNGAKSYSGEEIADAISKISEKKITFANTSVEQFKESVLGFIPDTLLDAIVEVYQGLQENPNLNDNADGSVEKITHEKPASLEDFLAKYVQYFK